MLSRALPLTTSIRGVGRPGQIGTAMLATRAMSSMTRDKDNPFWNHTTGKWLWNDQINRRWRYTPFDVDGLQNLACEVCSAKRCTSMVQLGHGFMTKVFRLQFDNAKELVARIPTMVVGDLEVSIASEAATTEYVRLRHNEGREDSWNMPKIPRVLSWNNTFKNPVKWPYILTEYIPGRDLQTVWDSSTSMAMKKTANSIVKFENTLLQDTFSHYGSLYFAQDVDRYDRNLPLYAKPPDDPLKIALSHKFRIGPIAHRDWWRAGLDDVPGARGPWTNVPEIIGCTAELQLRTLLWKTDYMYNPIFNKSTVDDFDFLLTPLKTCSNIMHDLVPKNKAMRRSVLQHPNLSRGNIILPHTDNPEPEIEGIVDWQGAFLAPFFVQASEAPAFTRDGPAKITGHWSEPVWYDEEEITSMSLEEQERIHMHQKTSRRDVYYLRTAALESYERQKVWWSCPGLPELAKLFRHLPRSIAEGPASLRCQLLSLKDNWESFKSNPCRIELSAEERETSEAEAKALDVRQRQMQAVLAGIGCSNDGWVEIERFDEANKLLQGFRRHWEGGGVEVEEAGKFPFYDGAYSPVLS